MGAAEALGRIGINVAVADLSKALSHEDSVVRRNVAEALGRIGSDAVVAALIKALDDEDRSVRSSAVEALGRIGSDTAIGALSAEAFGRTGSDVTIGTLIKALNYISEVEAHHELPLARAIIIGPPEILAYGEVVHDLIMRAEGAFPFRLSFLHPRKLSKGHSSPFIVVIYVPEKSNEAKEWIRKRLDWWRRQRQELEEQVEEAKLPTDPDAVNIRLSSLAIDFSEEKTRVLLRDQLNHLDFEGQPKDTCQLGTHTALLSITDKDGRECTSVAFLVEVVDFAFDNVSSPLLAKLTSLALGMGSFTTFTLTFLGQIDQTLGLAYGTAAGLAASFIYGWFLRFFKLLRSSVIEQ